MKLVNRLVARVKPRVPDRAWPVLLTLRSLQGALQGDGPLVAPPVAKRALVLAAHPDDESLGCAGTMAILAAAGAEVSVAFATDGEATRGATTSGNETARRRRAEAIEACAVLGVSDITFWGLPDGGLAALDLGGRVGAEIRARQPEIVFVPWFLDGHADHAALSAAVPADADVEVWGYETWTPLPANRVVDITSTFDRKRRALEAHATAALAFDVTAGLGLNRWRSIHGLMGRGYAEGFLVAPASQWATLR